MNPSASPAASASLAPPVVALAPAGVPTGPASSTGSAGPGREPGFARALDRAREAGSARAGGTERAAGPRAEGDESGAAGEPAARSERGGRETADPAAGRTGQGSPATAGRAAAERPPGAAAHSTRGHTREDARAVETLPGTEPDAAQGSGDKSSTEAPVPATDPLLAALLGQRAAVGADAAVPAPMRSDRAAIGACGESTPAEGAVATDVADRARGERPGRRSPTPAAQAFDRAADRAAERAAFIRQGGAPGADAVHSDAPTLRREGLALGLGEALRDAATAATAPSGAHAATGGLGAHALHAASSAAGTSTVGSTPVAEARLAAAPGQPGFAPALGAQLTLFVREGIQVARLQLHPAELGPVFVQIQIDGQAAQVHLAAENAFTRDKLGEALPVLAGSLRDAGLTLTGGGVFEQPRRDDAAPAPEGAARSGGRDGAARADAADAVAAVCLWWRGVVDLVA